MSEPQPGAMAPARLIVVVVSAVALVVAVVCIVLVLSYRSQEQAVTRQLLQVEQAQQQASKTAQQASTARLGICWNSTTDNTTFDVQSIQLASPVVTGGVYQCPSGMNFVSVVPATGS